MDAEQVNQRLRQIAAAWGFSMQHAADVFGRFGAAAVEAHRLFGGAALELDPARLTTPERPALFQVWIDVDAKLEPDWWWNSPPKPLADALAEAAECRAHGYRTCVQPEGVNPRPDGRWDNPV